MYQICLCLSTLMLLARQHTFCSIYPVFIKYDAYIECLGPPNNFGLCSAPRMYGPFHYVLHMPPQVIPWLHLIFAIPDCPTLGRNSQQLLSHNFLSNGCHCCHAILQAAGWATPRQPGYTRGSSHCNTEAYLHPTQSWCPGLAHPGVALLQPFYMASRHGFCISLVPCHCVLLCISPSALEHAEAVNSFIG